MFGKNPDHIALILWLNSYLSGVIHIRVKDAKTIRPAVFHIQADFDLSGYDTEIISTIWNHRNLHTKNKGQGWRSGTVRNANLTVAGSTHGLGVAAYRLWASCSHPCASVSKQYNLVPAKG